jgi:hypothetical protein
VGPGAAGVLADPGPLAGPAALVRTDAGSAAAQGTSPQSRPGLPEPPEKARARPPPATAATAAVMPAAVIQGCRARLSSSQPGPWPGWPGPLVTGRFRTGTFETP